MKGNSTCHVFTNKGRQNYTNMQWNSSLGKCKHRRTLNGNKCIINNMNTCPQNIGENVTLECPISEYAPILLDI